MPNAIYRIYMKYFFLILIDDFLQTLEIKINISWAYPPAAL